MIKNKKALQFAWIFSIIVGAIILFLAFYFVGTKLLSSKYQEQTQIAQTLDILLNPFSYISSFDTVTADVIELPKKSKIDFECSYSGTDPGYNKITLTDINSEQSGIPRISYDKYLFAESREMKKIQILSMPLNLPWRVADIIVLWPYEKNYCFVSAPIQIQNDLERLEITSIKIKESKNKCTQEDPDIITVCFSGSGCSIQVNYREGKTTRQSKTLYWTGDVLMYASIFSDPEIYECNVKRIASRLSNQIKIYQEKSIALSGKCNVNFNLAELRIAAESIETQGINQARISALSQAASTIDNQKNNCRLY